MFLGRLKTYTKKWCVCVCVCVRFSLENNTIFYIVHHGINMVSHWSWKTEVVKLTHWKQNKLHLCPHPFHLFV